MRMGTKLSTLLKNRGKMQQDLATVTGRSPATISMYCSGETAPGEDTLLVIAKFLEVDPAEIDIRPQRRPGTRAIRCVVDWPAFKAALEKRKKTLTELAREIGVTRQAMQAYHTGRANPTPSTLGRMARALTVNPLDLLTEEAINALPARKRAHFRNSVVPPRRGKSTQSKPLPAAGAKRKTRK